MGVLGTRRGMAFAEAAAQVPGARVVAFCGRDPRRLELVGERYPEAQLLTSYDELVALPEVDAVIVANYADEHAPAACRALGAGKHVLSEVPAFNTIAEGVELVRTVEATGRRYMLAENFCYLPWVQEMRRLYEAGDLGEIRYAEGEYVHFTRDVLHQLIDLDLPHHWRLWIPPTFYITHSLGPILRISGLRPAAVQAATGLLQTRNGGPPLPSPALETVRLENGALVKSLHGGPYPREPWQPWTLLGGTNGCIENDRWLDPHQLTRYLDGQGVRRYRAPLAEYAARAQHWGADYFVLERFVASVRGEAAPDFDVYMAADVTLCGHMAWRSVLSGGGWVEVPDFRDEAVRRAWADDRASCRPDAPAGDRLPNHQLAGATVLPPEEVLARIRARQAQEPYYAAWYRD
ncbi:MAG TPA: Gfo/Idh/MocA family oxidoreductase [Limnochordia bacterium]|nr:Gfo/Idh/MocA family oxidoreductase [Limnochordia bacterium]